MIANWNMLTSMAVFIFIIGEFVNFVTPVNNNLINYHTYFRYFINEIRRVLSHSDYCIIVNTSLLRYNMTMYKEKITILSKYFINYLKMKNDFTVYLLIFHIILILMQ